MSRRARIELASSHTPPRDRLRLRLLQNAPRSGAVADNILCMHDMIGSLETVDLVVTPELSVQGYATAPAADLVPIERQELIAEFGFEHAVVGIGFAEARRAGRPYNSFALIGPESTEVQHKLHPVATSPFDEHLVYEAGDALRAMSVHGVPIATVICNDMWHPVVPWLAVRQHAEVMVVPVASSDDAMPGVKGVWEAILRHTAQVLQCYVVFVNRCGRDGSLGFWGGSRVIGPDGDVMIQLGKTVAATDIDLDLLALRTLREQTPILAEVRTDFVLDDLVEV